MVPISKYGCEQAIKKWKKDEYEAFNAVDMYKEGIPKFGIKKDLRKALKIVKYWENKTKRSKRFFIYYNLEKIYRELGKTKEANYYQYKYYDDTYKIEKKDKYVISKCLELCIKLCIKKNKVIDKKIFEDLKFYINELIILIKQGLTSSDLYNCKDLILNVISTDTFNLRNKPLEMFINPMVYTKDYHKTLTKPEMVAYLDLYENHKTKLNECYHYLKAFTDYKYNKQDGESKCRYFAYYLDDRFVDKDINKAFTAFNEAYEEGYKEAYTYILNYYTRFGTTPDKIEFLSKYIKKYPKDINVKLEYADIIYNYNLVGEKLLNINEFKIAIDIYEQYLEYTNDEQKERLAFVYNKGLGVEQDFSKATKYSKSTSMMKKIEEEKIKRFTRLKTTNPLFNEEVEKLFKSLYTNDFEQMEKLWWLAFNGYKVEKYPDYLYDLATFIYEKEQGPIGAYLIAACYFNNLHVTMDEEKFYEYLNISLEANYPRAYNLLYLHLRNINADEGKIVAALEKAVELNSYPAICNKALSIRTGEFYEKDEVKAYEMLKDLYDKTKAPLSAKFLAYQYENGIGVEKDLKKAYELYLEYANTTNNSDANFKVYIYNLNNKFKDLSKEEAFCYLLRAGNLGYLEAYDYIGDCFYFGNGTPVNNELAFDYYKKSYDNGSKYAAYRLGIYYRIGIENKIKIDHKLALKYLEEAKEDKIYLKFILYEMGLIYLYNEFNLQDLNKAFRCLKEAYELGNTTAANRLAYCYRYGKGTKVDISKALKLFKEGYLTKQEDEMCQYMLVLINPSIENMKPDYEEAIKVGNEIIKLYPKNDKVYTALGICYEAVGNVDKEYDCYSLAYKYNPKNGLAAYYLGICYYEGLKVEKNYKKAIEYFEIAVKNNCLEGYLDLSRIYMDPNSNMQNTQKSFEYAKKAYEAGLGAGRGLMAIYYILIDKEYKKAYDLLKDSKRNTRLELEAYAELFYNGYYVQENYDIAFQSYLKASKIKMTKSLQFALGRCYYFGHGVEQDKEKAHDLIYLSAKKGYKPAINFINEFFKK